MEVCYYDMEEIDTLITQIIAEWGNKAHLDACAARIQEIARGYMKDDNALRLKEHGKWEYKEYSYDEKRTS